MGENGKEEMEEKGKRKREEERGKLIDNYYLLRMIINKRFSYFIQFFNFDIQYIDKYSIERKCIPYIPEYGKA